VGNLQLFQNRQRDILQPLAAADEIDLRQLRARLQQAMIGQYFLNSMIVIIPAIFFTLLFSA